MKDITLVIGGSRSGKSRYALKLAEKREEKHRFFVATCMPSDEEMKERIARHREERSREWHTLEVPLKLSESISEYGLEGSILLVDCITLWINNLFMESNDVNVIANHVETLITALEKAKGAFILVTNEVGTGIVPENQLARKFRDIAGFTNQRLAKYADEVIMMVAGIPVIVKGEG